MFDRFRWLTDKRLWLLVTCVAGAALLLNLPQQAVAGQATPRATPTPTILGASPASSSPVTSFSLNGFWQTLVEIAPVLFLAALLGGLVAYRRRLTVFEHNLFQAHILLSVAGALMMLIVGNQLVRAFGLLGAASVVRYRYGLRNPRDASLLIIALGVGMATGVGLYALAVSAAAVVFVFTRGLDFFTTRFNHIVVVTRPTTLRVRTTRPEETMARIEQVFGQCGIRSRLRRYRRARTRQVNGVPVFSLVYAVQLSPDESRSQLTTEIADEAILLVRWRTQKPKKS
jgi:uncharacterized membrane protein YhiD involved in acid resistance